MVEERVATGIDGLDKILGEGYAKGSTILFELNIIPFEHMAALLLHTVANILSHGGGVILIPPASHDASYIANLATEWYEIPAEAIEGLFRELQFTVGPKHSRYVVNLLDRSGVDAFKTWITNEARLVKTTGKPALHIGVSEVAGHVEHCKSE